MKNNLIIYEEKDGKTKVNVKFIDEDIWLTQNQIVYIYKATKQNINLHIKNIYQSNELQEKSTHKKFLLAKKKEIVR